MKQHLVTLALLLAILLLSIKLVQRFSELDTTTRQIVFSCAVAVQNEVGQVCIEGDPGGRISVTVTYCNQQRVNSPVMTIQELGTHEYRWMWLVHQPLSCTGQPARVLAWARWADGSQASAEAVFSIASITFEQMGRQNQLSDKRI